MAFYSRNYGFSDYKEKVQFPWCVPAVLSIVKRKKPNWTSTKEYKLLENILEDITGKTGPIQTDKIVQKELGTSLSLLQEGCEIRDSLISSLDESKAILGMQQAKDKFHEVSNISTQVINNTTLKINIRVFAGTIRIMATILEYGEHPNVFQLECRRCLETLHAIPEVYNVFKIQQTQRIGKAKLSKRKRKLSSQNVRDVFGPLVLCNRLLWLLADIHGTNKAFLDDWPQVKWPEKSRDVEKKDVTKHPVFDFSINDVGYISPCQWESGYKKPLFTLQLPA